MRFWKSSLILSALFFALTASAQINLGSILNPADNLTLRIMPTAPRAQSQVTAMLEGYSYNLKQTELSWFLDEKLVKKGVGETRLSFKTGALGSTSTVLVSGITLAGETFQKIIAVRPAEVDLVWESIGYTPPFYPGKTLYAYQGYLRVSAIANLVNSAGQKLANNELNFTWKQDGNAVPRASGAGKNIFNIKDQSGLIKPANVGVEVSSIDGAIFATDNLVVQPTEPVGIFYENNPVYGILYNQALSHNWQLQSEEATITFIPYFFSAKTRGDSNLSYKWNLNGQPTTSLTPGELTVRNDAGATGQALLTAEIASVKEIFQGVSSNLNVNFGTPNN